MNDGERPSRVGETALRNDEIFQSFADIGSMRPGRAMAGERIGEPDRGFIAEDGERRGHLEEAQRGAWTEQVAFVAGFDAENPGAPWTRAVCIAEDPGAPGVRIPLNRRIGPCDDRARQWLAWTAYPLPGDGS